MSPTRRIGGACLAAVLILTSASSAGGQGTVQRIGGPAAREAVTARQIENAQARIALATAIVDRLEGQAKALGRARSWRQTTLETLLSLPLAALQRVEREAHTADAIPAVAAATLDDPQALGDPDADLVYVPIAPCRFADSRNVGGRINGFREFDLALNGATYGGVASCTPPSLVGAAQNQIGALALNVTLVDPTVAPGFVAAKPTAASPLTSLLNWYEVGPSVQAANLGIVTMDQSGAGPEFVIQTSAPVHVILDVFGAFVAPQATALNTVNVVTPWSTATGTFDVLAVCPAGYSLTGGGFTRDVLIPDNLDISRVAPFGPDYRCVGASAVPETGTCIAVCARTPGR